MATGRVSGLQSATADYTTDGDQTALLSAAADETLLVYDLIISAAGAVTVTGKLGSTSKIKVVFSAAGTEVINLQAPIMGAKGEDLVMHLSAAEDVSVSATGRKL